MVTEKVLQNRIIKALRKRGAWVLNFPGAIHRGVPDLVACYKGMFLAIEVKREGGKLTALQRRALCSIKAAGGIAVVAVGDQGVEDVEVRLDLIELADKEERRLAGEHLEADRREGQAIRYLPTEEG